MKIKYILIGIGLFFLTSITGCVPVYHPIDAIDIYDHSNRLEVVYVPRYVPRSMYYYDGWWYDEPYTYITYQDIRGRIYPRKIPKRLMGNIEQRMKERKTQTKFPMGVPPKKREIIRRRIKKRSKK